VTNFNSSIKDYDLNFDQHVLATVMTQNLSENIFIDKRFDQNRQVFTPATRRKEILQAKGITERRKKETPSKPTSIKDLINSRLKEKTDTVQHQPPVSQPVIKKDTTTAVPKKNNGEISTDDYNFDEPAPVVKVQPKVIDKPTVQPKQKEMVNTDDYAFEEEVARPKNNETFLTRYMKAKDVAKVTGPFPYAAKFSYENLITNFVVDQLRGFSIRLETQMNDMLENYRFYGGLQVAWSDFKSGDVFGEFQYLPHRVDFSARFDRKVIFWQTHDETSNPQQQKYAFQKLELGASYPISVRTRVSFKPFIGYTEYVDRGPTYQNSPNPPTYYNSQTQFYGGARVELVYDNSIATGLNIIEGTRGKISLIDYEGIGNSKKSFTQVYADVRHYQKIYKEIVLAVRGYAGTFLGKSPKSYLLGGMDNWLGNTTNYNGSRNPLVNAGNVYNDNLLFSEFATGLRGFDYATQYGNSVALANAELRIPLIRALTNGPIASNFFRNLQFISFFDIGSSWTGSIPIGTANAGLIREVKNGPFDIQIKEYLNPWLYSYGAGFRTMMFGYYMKFDLAWPTVNYKVQDPRLQVTLGFDF
jgi:hypothetical protein